MALGYDAVADITHKQSMAMSIAERERFLRDVSPSVNGLRGAEK